MSIILKLSQLGGLVGDVINKIITSIINPIVSAIMTYLYTKFVLIWLVISDVLMVFFRKLVGLGTYKVTETNEYVQTDFVYSIITSDAIMNVFWAMVILAVVLLFITTFIAVIKSEFVAFSDKNANNSKTKIIGASVRALINFAVVPVCAIVGVLLGNALLRVIDGATGGGDGTSLGGRVFVASAYGANRVRKVALADSADDTTLWDDLDVIAIVHEYYPGRDVEDLTFEQLNEIANKVDERFENPYANGNLQLESYYVNVPHVIFYYNLMDFNFMICLITAISVCVIMLQIMLGLIKRIFAMATLFIIAPPIVAMTPIQPEILKKWNQIFIRHVLAAYSSLVALNMFLIVIKALQNVQFFYDGENQIIKGFTIFGWGAGLLNRLAYLLIVIGGLIYLKNVTKEIGDLIGGDDAYGTGVANTKEFVKKTGQVAGLAMGGVSAVKGLLGGGAAAKKGLGAAFNKAASTMNAATGDSAPTNDATQATADAATTAGSNEGLGTAVNANTASQVHQVTMDEVQNGRTVTNTPGGQVHQVTMDEVQNGRTVTNSSNTTNTGLANTTQAENAEQANAAETNNTNETQEGGKKPEQVAPEIGFGRKVAGGALKVGKKVGSSIAGFFAPGLKAGFNFGVDPETAKAFKAGFNSINGPESASAILGDLTGKKAKAAEEKKKFNSDVDSALKNQIAKLEAEGKHLTNDEIKGLRSNIAQTFKNVSEVTKQVAEEEASAARSGRDGKGKPVQNTTGLSNNYYGEAYRNSLQNRNARGLERFDRSVDNFQRVTEKLEKAIEKLNKKK